MTFYNARSFNTMLLLQFQHTCRFPSMSALDFPSLLINGLFQLREKSKRAEEVLIFSCVPADVWEPWVRLASFFLTTGLAASFWHWFSLSARSRLLICSAHRCWQVGYDCHCQWVAGCIYLGVNWPQLLCPALMTVLVTIKLLLFSWLHTRASTEWQGKDVWTVH